MLNIFDRQYPLNVTMTQAPKLDGKDGLLEFNFDGTFFDIAN